MLPVARIVGVTFQKKIPLNPFLKENSAGFVVKYSNLGSFHPETRDVKLFVSDLESGDFLFWPGNQGLARRRTTVRRTSKTED
jgi:hypothetical protein